MNDEEFLSKTINDSRVDLDKIPAGKVMQLAKKMKASKATVCHIKQVARYPQVTQINLMRHQGTDLSPSKHKKKAFSQDHSPKQYTSEQKQVHTSEEGVPSVGIPDMWKVSNGQPRSISVSPVTSQPCVLRNKYLSNQGHPKETSYKVKKCICKKIPYVTSQKN